MWSSSYFGESFSLCGLAKQDVIARGRINDAPELFQWNFVKSVCQLWDVW